MIYDKFAEAFKELWNPGTEIEDIREENIELEIDDKTVITNSRSLVIDMDDILAFIDFINIDNDDVISASFTICTAFDFSDPDFKFQMYELLNELQQEGSFGRWYIDEDDFVNINYSLILDENYDVNKFADLMDTISEEFDYFIDCVNEEE